MKPPSRHWLGLCGIAVLAWILLLTRLHVLSKETETILADSSAITTSVDSPPAAAGALSEPAPDSGGAGPNPAGGEAVTAVPCVDVNRSGADELVRLPGIGPVLADRIVAYRSSTGRFSSAADLVKVKGIGPAKLGKIEMLICF